MSILNKFQSYYAPVWPAGTANSLPPIQLQRKNHIWKQNKTRDFFTVQERLLKISKWKNLKDIKYIFHKFYNKR